MSNNMVLKRKCIDLQEIIDRVTAERDAALAAEQVAIGAIAHNQLVIKDLQQRLTAADERADVLETALRKIKVRLDAYAESDMRMPEPSVEVCQAIADAALKPAEGGGDPCEFCKGWGFRSNPDGADEGCGPCSGTGKEPSDDQP